ncbi:MAG: TRAP transporter small permease [Blautia sp.]
MIEAMDKFIGASFKVLRLLLSVVLLGMVAILMAHIFCRYILNNSLTWSEELLKILLVWFGMLSVSLLAIRREHVAIVVFKEHMPGKLADFFSKVTQVLTVVICLAVMYVGIQYVLEAGYRPTPALRLPYGYAYAAIPISFFFVTIYEFRNLLVDLTGKGNYAAVEKPEEDLTGGAGVSLETKGE